MPETHPVWNMASAVAPQCTAVVLDRVWWSFLVLGSCSFGVTELLSPHSEGQQSFFLFFLGCGRTHTRFLVT